LSIGVRRETQVNTEFARGFHQQVRIEFDGLLELRGRILDVTCKDRWSKGMQSILK
jgi:hypothetical protein